MSILLMQYRDDRYPKPFEFRPERFSGVRPDPHALLEFGGGNRRCLGATLAMAELRVVVREILRRLDLDTHDRSAERAKNRNVTMIPADGAVVTVRSKY